MCSQRLPLDRKATLRVQRLYGRFAPIYDVVSPALSLGRWQAWQGRVLPHAQGRVLDVGCGTGVLLERLADRGAPVGLDLSPGMLARARRRQARRGFATPLVCGDAQDLPFRDGVFDSVVSTFAVNAVPDLECALREMLRVLRASGSLAFISVGESEKGGRTTRWATGVWRREGDIVRDEVGALRRLGLECVREDFGPFGTIHLIAVVKP